MVDATVQKKWELTARFVRGTCMLVAFDDCRVTFMHGCLSVHILTCFLILPDISQTVHRCLQHKPAQFSAYYLGISS